VSVPEVTAYRMSRSRAAFCDIALTEQYIILIVFQISTYLLYSSIVFFLPLVSGMGTVLASSTKFGYPTCWIDSRRSPEVKESSAPPDAGVVVVVVVVDVLVVVPVPVIPSVEVVCTAKS
jgi:hypothetical protein